MATSCRLLIGFSFGFSCSTFTNGRIGGDGILFVDTGVLFDVCLFAAAAVVVVVVCAVVSFDSIASGTRASAFEAVALLSELFKMSMTSRKTIKT